MGRRNPTHDATVTARAFTVDRAGRKHEVRRKRQSARELFLDRLDAIVWEPRADRSRALRRYERELAERAAFALHRLYAEAVRAAILGQPRAKKGGR